MNRSDRLKAVMIGASLLLAAWIAALASADESPRPPKLTAAQQAQLDEAERLHSTATKLYTAGKIRDATEQSKQVVAIRRKVLGDKHPDTASALNDLGVLLKQTGDLAAARACYEQALTIQTQVLGEKNLHTAATLSNLGALFHKNGRVDGGPSPTTSRAWRSTKRFLGNQDPNTARALNNVGQLLAAFGKPAEARADLQQALAIRRATLGEKHLETAQSLNNLGVVLNELGEFAAARSCLEQSLAIHRELFSQQQHPGACTWTLNQARARHSRRLATLDRTASTASTRHWRSAKKPSATDIPIRQCH